MADGEQPAEEKDDDRQEEEGGREEAGDGGDETHAGQKRAATDDPAPEGVRKRNRRMFGALLGTLQKFRCVLLCVHVYRLCACGLELGLQDFCVSGFRQLHQQCTAIMNSCSGQGHMPCIVITCTCAQARRYCVTTRVHRRVHVSCPHIQLVLTHTRAFCWVGCREEDAKFQATGVAARRAEALRKAEVREREQSQVLRRK